MSEIPLALVVGSADNKPLYAVTITAATLRRARELAVAGVTPDWILDQDGAFIRIMTTQPKFFTDLERDILAAVVRQR